MLRLFKVESRINGLLPLDKLGVPSIYSVSRLSRRRSALGRLLSFALRALSSFLATVSQPRKKPWVPCSGSQQGGGFAFWVDRGLSKKDDTGGAFYRSTGI